MKYKRTNGEMRWEQGEAVMQEMCDEDDEDDDE